MVQLNIFLTCACLVAIVNCDLKVRNFPPGFKFGAATAAYQIEGGWDEDGKTPSIWDHITHTDYTFVRDGTNGDVAANSYHLLETDIQMIKDLGLDFYRFSIAWTRILPTGFPDQINKSGVKYYNDLINGLLSHGIEPIATIYHWDLPQSLQDLGGFANPLISDWMADYAEVLFDQFGDRVKLWITINEPKQICYEGYGSDLKAPALNMTGTADYICVKNVLISHAQMYDMYDKKFRSYQNGRIGISISCTWFEAYSNAKDDQQAAVDARRFDWGFYAHPIFSTEGDYPIEVKRRIAQKSKEQGFKKSRLPELSQTEIDFIKGSSDFFGMNSYTTKLVYRNSSVDGVYAVPSYSDDIGVITVKDDSWPQSESTWLQAVPWGFYNIFTEIRSLYNNPTVFVTENGWSSGGGLDDEDRISYYKGYLNALLNAVEEGSDIRHYTAWSLMDNFEWKGGYSEKFGIYEVDFNSPNRTRTPRKSALFFKELIKSRSLDLD